MTPSQFWYGDIYLLDAYVEAYNNKCMNTARLNGFYNHLAMLSALSSIFGEKENSNYYELVEKVENYKEKSEETMAKENKEKTNFWSTLKQRALTKQEE